MSTERDMVPGAIPKNGVLRAEYNDQYLRFINEDVQVHGFLQFSGEEAVSPYSKYETEPATGKGLTELVHIRCCYNNKYWVRLSPFSWWIVAAADEPVEDQKQWFCTLFCPVFDPASYDQTIRLRHVQLGHFVRLSRDDPPFNACLFAGSPDEDKDQCDVFTAIDWESFVPLPKHIALKGDNDKYLSARVIERDRCLQFDSDDRADRTVGQEVFTTRDGSVRIRSDLFDMFWRRSHRNWILANSCKDDSCNPDALFWPIKVDKDGEYFKVALRNLGNNYYCERLTKGGKTNCLNAATPDISSGAYLVVEEYVLSRNIDNVNYRLLDARIYNQHEDVHLAHGDATNKTDQPIKVDIKLEYKNCVTVKWDSIVWPKLDVATKIQARIPTIEGGKIVPTVEYTGDYKWGETVEICRYVVPYSVIVPPMSRVTVNLWATKGFCDVPFSYSQTDTLPYEKQIILNLDDGLFTGSNYYNFKYDVEEEKIRVPTKSKATNN